MFYILCPFPLIVTFLLRLISFGDDACISCWLNAIHSVVVYYIFFSLYLWPVIYFRQKRYMYVSYQTARSVLQIVRLI